MYVLVAVECFWRQPNPPRARACMLERLSFVDLGDLLALRRLLLQAVSRTGRLLTLSCRLATASAIVRRILNQKQKR